MMLAKYSRWKFSNEMKSLGLDQGNTIHPGTGFSVLIGAKNEKKMYTPEQGLSGVKKNTTQLQFPEMVMLWWERWC
jgi:hypothetical protein